MNLSQQRVMVVGGTGKMGSATAALAQQLGAEVIVSARTEPQDIPAEYQFVQMDASVSEDVERELAKLPPLDHLVVAVSASGKASGIDTTSAEDAQLAFVRFWSAYNILHIGSKSMSRNGSITLVSGSSSRRPVRGFGVWTALHGAIESLAKAAAIDLAPLRINIVSPGGIEMEPDRQLVEHAGKAGDVAAMIAAVMCNAAVTNAVIDVDGGERLGNWPSKAAVR